MKNLGRVSIVSHTHARMLTHTHLDDAVDQWPDGLFNVTFSAEHEQCVLEVATQTAVCVCPAQNHVILTVHIAIFLLQRLQHLHTHTHRQN